MSRTQVQIVSRMNTAVYWDKGDCRRLRIGHWGGESEKVDGENDLYVGCAGMGACRVVFHHEAAMQQSLGSAGARILHLYPYTE